MTTQTQTDTKTNTMQCCRGCCYLERRFKAKHPDTYKCIASGIKTFSQRTACSLWKPRL